ncbi:class I SAM-dependent methyltransferase [bacterium]|nr:class I SAM-dependent methyltransferase [bacterium]
MLYHVCVLFALAFGWIAWRRCSNAYTLPCPAWLAWMVELDNPFAKAHQARTIIHALPYKKGMSILDVGCGPGRVLVPLAQHVVGMAGQVTGLDVQAEMLEKAATKAKQQHVNNADFIHGTIDAVPLDRHYDAILLVCVLGEIPRDERAHVLKKIISRLKTGGIISVTETIFDPHFQSYRVVAHLMEDAGLHQILFVGNRFAYTAHFAYSEEKVVG